MYELSRVRLYSVGPPGARYHDVVLDWSEIGEVILRPVAMSLFDTDADEDGPGRRRGRPGHGRGSQAPRRPAPASVLFTENGNGKSVLIKLIFSVVLPGRKNVVGSAGGSKALDNFVLARDVAHVALEWQHVRTGERVITGKVAAWSGQAVSSDSSRLAEAWWSLRPDGGCNLDTLPITEGGQVVSMGGFKARLTAATVDVPARQFGWEDNQANWTTKLDALGLDPELFAYQRRMNGGEGEAADAFALKSDQAFVDWLLTAVTDQDDPRRLADILNGYATTLAQRDTLIAERQFVIGALERLHPLAAAARDQDAALAIARETAADATRFVTAVTGRRCRDELERDELATQAAMDTETVEAADRDQRRLNAISLEMRRYLAGMELGAAQATADAIKERLTEARALLTGWRSTPVLLTYRDATAIADSVRDVVGEQETQAEPARRRRDTAAHRLVAGLLGAAEQASADAVAARGGGAALNQPITEAADADRAHTGTAAREEAAAEQARARIVWAQSNLAAATTAGLLPPGSNPAQTAAAATIDAAQARARLDEHRIEQDRLARARQNADRVARDAMQAEHEAERVAVDAARAAGIALAQTAELEGEQRLADLLGVKRVDLRGDAPALLDRLLAAAVEQDNTMLALTIADAADQVVLTALGTGGLLPPRADVSAVQDVLTAHKITSYAGWQYLAQLPDAERGPALAAYPHLADGVVVNDPGQREQARKILTGRRLLPRSAVAVGVTATFTDLTVAPPTGLDFLVPPNPALYDEALAETERQRLLAVAATRRRQIAALTAAVAADRALRVRVDDWSRAYPAGALDTLVQARDDTAVRHDSARHAAAAAEGAKADLITAEQEHRDNLRGLETAAAHARERAGQLSTLAAEQAQVPDWVEQELAALAAALTAYRDAATAADLANELRDQQGEAIRVADSQDRIAVGARDEIRDVLGGGSAPTGAPTPPEPTATLRSEYRAAVTAYEKVQVGVDLRQQLEGAERHESETRAALEKLPDTDRVTAAALLATPDGVDAAARAAATDRAARTVDRLTDQLRDADSEVGRLRERYESLVPQDRGLDPYGRPDTVEDAKRLVAQVNQDWRAADARYQTLLADLIGLRERISALDVTNTGFGHILDVLADYAPTDLDLGPELGVPPFAGTLQQAESRRADLRAALAESGSVLGETTAELRRTASRLSQYANEPRFDAINSPVQHQIRKTELDGLPGYAADWETALRPRLRSLTDDLAQIDRHRSQIITRLRGMVEAALATLRSAERLSVLPDSLGDWAGQKFLRIAFADPDQASLDERLGAVVDEAAALPARGDQSGSKRDGFTLLLKGVRAALPRGVKVDMLKPDAAMRLDRIRIGDVAEVFSGGQLLTAAIILYCTMAALRANERGQTRKHSGVLFLDNPIGRASAGYLLDLQLAVARALGVQLIYTTGIFDIDALSAFPLIIRLRNDLDLRSGMNHLVISDQLRAALDELGQPDGQGRIQTARMFRTPHTPDGVPDHNGPAPPDSRDST